MELTWARGHLKGAGGYLHYHDNDPAAKTVKAPKVVEPVADVSPDGAISYRPPIEKPKTDVDDIPF